MSAVEEQNDNEFLHGLEFQRHTLKLLATNIQFATSYGPLLKDDYFESQYLRIIYSQIKEHVFTYETEIDLSSLMVKLDHLSMSHGYASTMTKELALEARATLNSHIKSEQFIIDTLVSFARRQELKSALLQSVDILEKNGNYERVLQLIDEAVSVGSGVDDGMTFDDFYDLPGTYMERYDPKLLIPTGLVHWDEAFDGGMAPGELHVVLAPPKAGKCLAKGTRVIMFDGSLKVVEDVQPNDLLMGPDSKSRKVIGINNGRDLMYTIHQNKGMSYTVNSDHILSLKHCSTKQITNIDVKSYLLKNKEFKYRHKGYKVGVEFSRKELDLHPYFVGLWLGNGDHKGVGIHNQDNAVVGFLMEYAQTVGCELSKISHKDENCFKFSIVESTRNSKRHPTTGKYDSGCNPILNGLKKIGVIGNKHIPFEYLTNDRESRLQLLAGLIDTDGYNGGSDGKSGVVFSNTNEKVARQTCWLAQSLGFRATVSTKRAFYKGTKYGYDQDYETTEFKVFIWGDVGQIPCRLSHKNSGTFGGRDVLVTGIKIEEIGIGEYFGFELDNDGLFLLEDFTVTHNTSLGVAVGAYNVKRGKSVFHVTLELKKPDIGMKYMTNITGMTRKAIIDCPPEKWKMRLSGYKKKTSNLYIQYWTEKTVNALVLRSWISRIRSKTGIKPDLIIVDYDDLLNPVAGTSDSMYDDSGNIYSDLIGLADYFACPVLTFSQGQRESWDLPNQEKCLQASHLAHSSKKAHKCYSISTLNFKDDSDNGILFADLVRRGTSKVKIKIRKDLSRSMIIDTGVFK